MLSCCDLLCLFGQLANIVTFVKLLHIASVNTVPTFETVFAAEALVKVVDDTLSFYYLDDKEFLRQMAGCRAYASTAGFESICEAMYLGKPLMMVPSHIEQKCNAYDATRESAAIESDKFDLSVLLDFAEKGHFHRDEKFPDWALSAAEVIVNELETLA